MGKYIYVNLLAFGAAAAMAPIAIIGVSVIFNVFCKKCIYQGKHENGV